MNRYYNPSKEEEQSVDCILKELKIIAREKLKYKDPGAYFDYLQGEHYAIMRKGKELNVVVDDIDGRQETLVIIVKNGAMISCSWQGEILYKGKESRTPIRKGGWVEEYDKKRQSKNTKKDKDIEFYCRPTYIKKESPKKEETVFDEFDEKYCRYMERRLYCQQYQEMFGTKSLFVSDDYFILGDE